MAMRGMIRLVALASALLAASWPGSATAGRHAGAGASLWEGDRRVAGVGEKGSIGAGRDAGETIDLGVALEVAEGVRGARVVVLYDSTTVEFAGWQKARELPDMLEIGPVVNARDQRVVHNVAFPVAASAPEGGRLVIGTMRFALRAPGPGTITFPYVELVDEELQTDALGVLPEASSAGSAIAGADPDPVSKRSRRELRSRDLGDGYSWSEAWPNPFSDYTKVTFIVPDSVFVSIDVVNARGDIVRPLVSDLYKGRYSTSWVGGKDFGGERVRYGTYTLHLRAGDKEDRQTVEYVAPPGGTKP